MISRAEIREVFMADAPGLAALHAEAFTDPWTTEALSRLMTIKGAFALANEDGFVLARALAGEAEVLTLAVRPAARRQGLGRALVEAVATRAIDAGARSLFLEVAADNGAALGLYRECGFVPVGRRGAYYRRASGPAMDALVLRRTLIAEDA
jgi:ribosomal-protein-alanine N-acetyltransferase